MSTTVEIGASATGYGLIFERRPQPIWEASGTGKLELRADEWDELRGRFRTAGSRAPIGGKAGLSSLRAISCEPVQGSLLILSPWTKMNCGP